MHPSLPLLLLAGLFGQAAAQQNIFLKKGTWSVKKNLKIGKVDLPTDYTVQFTLTPQSKQGGWRNIIHFTTGGDCCGYGSRIPGIWFYSSSTRLLVVDGHTRNGNDYCTGGRHNNQLPLKKKSVVKIALAKKQVNIYVNGQKVCTKNRHDRKIFRDVTVYGSDPWYNAAATQVTDLVVHTIEPLARMSLAPMFRPSREHRAFVSRASTDHSTFPRASQSQPRTMGRPRCIGSIWPA